MRAFADSNGSGAGDFTGLINRLDYLQWLGVDCLWLPPFYASPAARRRLRHLRLHRGAARVRHAAGVHRAGLAGARPRHPDHHRPRHEPHQRPAPVVPGQPRRPRRPVRRLLRLVRHRRRRTPTRGSSSSTPRSRTGPSTRCAGSSSGTASSATSPTSTSRTRPCRRRCSTSSGSGWTSGIDGFRLDAVPYLFEEEGTNCENLPRDARVPRQAARHGRHGVPRPDPARRGQPAAGARSSTTSAPRRRRSARCASTSR